MAVTKRSAPHFPNELYREIATNFHQRRDKDVLLSLALANSVWRHESQRVLFSSLSNNWAVLPDSELTHLLFLESILAHPDRLGPYVYLYAQDALAVDPISASKCSIYILHNLRENIQPTNSNTAVEDPKQQYHLDWMRIWKLTSRALPAMINLKHLYMSPIAARSMAEYLLVGCKFQLETLVWGCDEDPQDQLITFLRTQRVLTHLQVGQYVQEFNLLWLTPDICPTLTSTVCNMESVGLLEHRNDIITLQLNIPEDIEELTDNVLSVLERIKYLSVWIRISSGSFSRPTFPNLFLLEIHNWKLETLRSFSDTALPNLRVLALLNDDTIVDDPDVLVQVSRLCLSQLPKLETIFIRPRHFNEEKPFGYHTKISLNRAHPDAVMEVSWVLGECQLPLPWWSVYDTML